MAPKTSLRKFFSYFPVEVFFCTIQTRSNKFNENLLSFSRIVEIFNWNLFFSTYNPLQISCLASVYSLYNERVDRLIDEDRPTVFSASASQSFIDMPSSHYSSYHDSHDTVNNHNDAQIQGKRFTCSLKGLFECLKWKEREEEEEMSDMTWSGINSMDEWRH